MPKHRTNIKHQLVTWSFIKKHQRVTKHQIDMDKIHQCHHKKQEHVAHIHQDNEETVATSKPADESLLQHITALSYVIQITKELFLFVLCCNCCFVVVMTLFYCCFICFIVVLVCYM